MTTDESNATRELVCIRTPIGGHRAPRRAPTRCLAWHSGAHPAPPVSRESLLAPASLLLDLLEVEVAAPGGRKRCSGHWARTKGGSEATNGPLARKLRLGAGHRGLWGVATGVWCARRPRLGARGRSKLQGGSGGRRAMGSGGAGQTSQPAGGLSRLVLLVDAGERPLEGVLRRGVQHLRLDRGVVVRPAQSGPQRRERRGELN